VKSIIRSLSVNILTIWLAGQLFPGISLVGGWKTLFWAAVALGLIELLVKPVLNLLLLPINLLTLGTFRWVVNVLGLFFVTVLVPGFAIRAFHFTGFSSSGLVIPAVHISLLFSYILGSFIISLINTFINWLVR
jgi:putative membrane protein